MRFTGILPARTRKVASACLLVDIIDGFFVSEAEVINRSPLAFCLLLSAFCLLPTEVLCHSYIHLLAAARFLVS